MVEGKGVTSPMLEVDDASRAPIDLLDLRPRKHEGALRQLVELALARGVVRDPAWALRALTRRERFASTAGLKGVALPNARSIAVVRPWLGLGRSLRGLDWPGSVGEPVRLVLCVLSPAGVSLERHLARVAQALHHVRLQRQREWLLGEPGTSELRAWFASVGS